MKRLLMALTAVVALAAAESRGAVMSYRSTNTRQASPAPMVYGTPSRSNYGYSGYSYGYPRRRGPFSGLMELERRKNAALRRMFGGF